jgi:hypothetical protein
MSVYPLVFRRCDQFSQNRYGAGGEGRGDVSYWWGIEDYTAYYGLGLSLRSGIVRHILIEIIHRNTHGLSDTHQGI